MSVKLKTCAISSMLVSYQKPAGTPCHTQGGRPPAFARDHHQRGSGGAGTFHVKHLPSAEAPVVHPGLGCFGFFPLASLALLAEHG